MWRAGGGGFAPDIFIPRETGLSRKHLVLDYIENEWFLKDDSSTNGTYILAKNQEQYEKKKQSAAFPIFSDITSNDFAVIIVGKYTFAVRKT